LGEKILSKDDFFFGGLLVQSDFLISSFFLKIMPKRQADQVARNSSAAEIYPDDFTRNQLLEMFRSRVSSSSPYSRSAALASMNKAQLALLLNASASSSSSSAAAASSVPAPPSAKTLCESNLPGTTSELRRLAVQRGVAHASTLTKQQLCAALAVASDNEASAVQDEEMELPAGFLDLVTQEVMCDPIVASDGYSYDRTSLRNMFLVDARRFAEQGRPAGRPPRVMSLKDPSLELKNPFPGIPDWPASFPLIRNHDLRRSIDEWLLEHGLPASQKEGEEKESEQKESEPVYSRRDGDGFQNGIFYGAPRPKKPKPKKPRKTKRKRKIWKK